MVLFIRAYLGGVLTILSPCIPVLPQSRAERRPGDTRQVGGNEGIGHDVKPVYLVLKGFETRVPGHERGKQFAARRRRDGAQESDRRQLHRLLLRAPRAAAPPSSVMNARRFIFAVIR